MPVKSWRVQGLGFIGLEGTPGFSHPAEMACREITLHYSTVHGGDTHLAGPNNTPGLQRLQWEQNTQCRRRQRLSPGRLQKKKKKACVTHERGHSCFVWPVYNTYLFTVLAQQRLRRHLSCLCHDNMRNVYMHVRVHSCVHVLSK